MTKQDILVQAASLMRDIESADDRILRIERPTPHDRKLHRRLVNAARVHKLVPDGFALLHTGRDNGDIVLHLADVNDKERKAWASARYKARHEVTDPAEIEALADKGLGFHIVHEDMRDEAIALVKLFVKEAFKAGLRIVVAGKFLLFADGQRREVHISQEYESVPHTATAEELRKAKRDPWGSKIPEFDRVPVQRLRLFMNYGYNQRDEWPDISPGTYPKTVRKIVAEVIEHAKAERLKREESQRVAEAQAAEWRRKDELTRQEWQAAIDAAKVPAAQNKRTDVFMNALEDFQTAAEIRQFCAALAASGEGAYLEAWQQFGLDLAQAIDPLTGAEPLADTDFDVELSSNDLEPFLDGWSPQYPVRRNTPSHYGRQEHHQTPAPWYPGMRGQWWRHR